MADDLARAEYPSMLANLQPAQAVQVLSDRIKRINRINTDVADWFQERRRVEEQYVLSLRKLAQFKVPNAQTELGVFQSAWGRINDAIETIAQSHHYLADRIEQDVEQPLRAFQQKKDVQNINTMASNLASIAKDLEEAQGKTDKLNKKGGKASTQKVGAANSKLESANQQWDSQAPYIFETLQALDESRINQLRDLLTQYQTLESDQAQRTQDKAVDTLAHLIEVSTEVEIQGFVHKTTSGRPKLAARPSARQNTGLSTQSSGVASQPPGSSAGSNVLTPTTSQQQQPPQQSPRLSSQPEPPAPRLQPSRQTTEDSFGEPNSSSAAEKPGSKLRRFGTMLGGRRRQSVIGGFGTSPQKGSGAGFGRLGGPPGRGVSPRTSASNLRTNSGLAALSENANSTGPAQDDISAPPRTAPEDTNGVRPGESLLDAPVPTGTAPTGVNGTHEPDVSDVAPPPGPPPQQRQASFPQAKDSEGFAVPPPMNDPISQAQREAASEEADQLFKLDIKNKPIEEEDPEAKQAAMSSVSNTLRMGPAARRTGTVRGRRDVRNTIYVPSPTTSDGQNENPMGSVPFSPQLTTPVVAALAHGESGTSDSQSVRSGTSLGSLAQTKHAEMNEPGLNSSIIETVSAVFEDGLVKSTSISGEIAFVNNSPDPATTKNHETIKINNFPNLERIGPNRIFVQNAPSEQPEQFILDLSHLTKMSTAFSYKVFSDDAEPGTLGQNAPLLLKSAWKPQGDKLGLLLQYQLNPASKFTAPLTLHNVVFVATYNGKASGAQTKPSGTHLKDKHLVYWRLGDVTLTSEMQKIVCRVIGAEGVEPTPGHVEARWEYVASADEALGSGISISRLDDAKGKGKEVDDDPFADESTASSAADQTWLSVPLARRLVSGKYEGK